MSPPVVADDRPRHAWIASLLATLVTPPLVYVALLYSMFAPMACDPCSDADDDRMEATFAPAFTVSCCGLLLALVTVVASWGLSRRRPAAAIGLAVAAPLVVGLTWTVFMIIIGWP
ncbi:hypothetical protein [Streptomyces sp. NPDC013181]|uniref:hypothetical protein n=1 Tax=unclassified Streptomyces TaxID=2593676 RepID=UPI00369B7643